MPCIRKKVVSMKIVTGSVSSIVFPNVVINYIRKISGRSANHRPEKCNEI